MAEAESSTPEIPDDWLNDYTDYRQCFVCGSGNAGGLGLVYRQEGDTIVTGDFTPNPLPAMTRAVKPPSLTVGRLSAA